MKKKITLTLNKMCYIWSNKIIYLKKQKNLNLLLNIIIW